MGRSERIGVRTLVFLFVGVWLMHTFGWAQSNFLYTNNNNYFTANTVSGYSVAATGAATQIPHSPFSTGGTGNGGNGFIAANRITVCSKFLYASNDYSGSVSGFSINANTGDLTAVPDSPFRTGESSYEGIAVAVSPTCKFLFVANLSASKLFAFGVENNGSLVPVKHSPLSLGDQPNTLSVSADGSFLAVAYDGYVGMYSIGVNGVLTTVSGSPFSVSDPGNTGVMDFNCSTSLLYVPQIDDTVEVYGVAADGVLSTISGSPFASPSENYVSGLSPSGKFLFTSDGSSGVNSFDVGAGGALTTITGSPFSADLLSSSGLSVNKEGTFVYVSDPTYNEFSVMKINQSGALELVKDSPISTGQSGGLFSLVAYPPRDCKL
jgi:6-phosphogluconolactonase